MNRLEPLLIVGIRNIAAALGVGPDTVRYWADDDGFPIIRRPSDDAYITSRPKLEQWIEVNIPTPKPLPPEKRASLAKPRHPDTPTLFDQPAEKRRP